MSKIDNIIETIKKLLLTHYEKNSPDIGSIDLFFTYQKDFFSYCELLIQLLLMWRCKIESQPAMFEKVIFIIPSAEDISDILKIENSFNEHLEYHKERTSTQFISVTEFDLDTIFNLINGLDINDNTAVVIHHIENIFTINQSVNYWKTEENNVKIAIDNDDLYENIVNVVYSLAEYVKDKNIYMIVDSNLPVPNDSKLSKCLSNVENLGITGISYVSNKLDERVPKIVELVKRKDFEGALNLVLELEDNLTRLQMFYYLEETHKRRYFLIYIQEIFKEIKFEGLDWSATYKIAQIASYCGNDEITYNCIKTLIKDSNAIDRIEKIYDLTTQKEFNDILEKVVEKLQRVYPKSTKLLCHNLKTCIDKKQYSEAIQILETDYYHKNAEETDLYSNFLQRMLELENSNLNNYLTITNELNANDFHFFNILFDHAISKNLYYHANIITDVFEAKKKDHNRKFAIKKRIELLKEYFFCAKPENNEVTQGLIIDIIHNIVSYIALYSDDNNTKQAFLIFLNDERHYAHKLAILIQLAINNFHKIKKISNIDTQKGENTNGEEFKPIFESCLAYLSNKPYILGVTIIPRNLLPEDELTINKLTNFIDQIALSHAQKSQLTDEDIKLLNTCIIVSNSISSYYPQLITDINILEILCCSVFIDKPQLCRDYLEQISQISTNSFIRKKQAWLATADVYHRLKYFKNSLTFLLCGLIVPTELSLENFYKASSILIRVLRDIGFTDQAENILQETEATFSSLNKEFYLKYKHIYDFFRLTIKQKQLLSKPVQQKELLALINDACNFTRNEMEKNRSIKQISVIVIQLYSYGMQHNITLPEKIINIIKTLDEKDKGIIENIYQFFKERNVDSLFQLYQNMEISRYSEDISYDYNLLALYAKTLLNESSDDNGNVLALELLTDQSIIVLNENAIYTPLPKYATKTEPKEILEKITSQKKISILMLGRNNNNQLFSLLCTKENKLIPIIESEEIFSVSQFSKWRKHYPYAYADYRPDQDSNLFYDSLKNIGLSQQLDAELMVILDTEIHTLVPNLLLINNEFLGSSTAVTVAPSLGWINYKLEHPLITNNNFVCWISTAEKEGYTLKLLADTFSEELFKKYNISLNTEASLPETFRGSELVIIAAHGGVTESENTFYSISDEGGLKTSANNLASKLAQCGVVILFVCNSGRFNSHPESRTTVSLVKELLNKGCDTIIAPPWPLDALITLKWLPKFLEKWTSGLTVNMAVFEANQYIAKCYDYDPSKYLALNVYGNPFRKFTNQEKH